MVAQPFDSLTGTALIAAKARAYFQMLKARLSLLVAFSCAFGFVLAWLTSESETFRLLHV